ncbi:MAG: hypothetical protein IT424_08490 [Pirellulales bacterium]|nr:hypothetical protein [Pirellulales bacterium]
MKIFVPLLNEGTDVVRPTLGRVIGPSAVEVLPTSDYDPDAEEWQFPPGTKVQCVRETRQGGTLLVARQRIE